MPNEIASMNGKTKQLNIKQLSFGGVIVTLGIVFGDLGTSPLYTMKAILLGGRENINELLILGSLSLYFLDSYAADNH